MCVLMSPNEKSLKTQAVALRTEGESLWLLSAKIAVFKKGPCFSKQMLCLMDVKLNYTCLYSPSCDDCTVAINRSLWTMFLLILPPL